MAGEPLPRAAYRFDRFTLDLGRGVLLLSDGAEVALRPKSFALLQLLVERAGHLVSRDAIMTAIWPDVLVTDDSISQCVSEVRHALGDGAHRLLQTHPRRGYRLTCAVTDQAKIDSTVARLPAEAEDVASPRSSAAEGTERRQLTVLFCELPGAAALAQRLDPEDLGEILRLYHECCAAQVVRAGGHVARYLDDGMLAYFGYPRAHEDDAERAVRAGLAIIMAAAKLPGRGGASLDVRIGIATGPVVTNRAGAGGRDELAVGEPVSLAGRLAAVAAPGTVVIAERTRRLVGELFALENLGRHEARGFAGPVQVWRVTGEGAVESRFAALRGARLTPLIGRRQELDLVLDRWSHAKQGEGQVVLLAGEAGIGKSRLVRALADELGKECPTTLSHYCSPNHASTALYPIMGYIERASGLRREDLPEQQLARLNRLLEGSEENAPEGAWLLADLLGMPVEGLGQPRGLSPEQKKERVFSVLLGHLVGLATRGPVLALYDDAHWADPTTLELLHRVIDRVQQLPVLVVITFRPELNPPWSGYGHVITLSLARLSRRQGAAMIEQVAAGKAVPAGVRDQILARTDGVPLFVEELTKMLLESSLLKDTGDRYELVDPLPLLAIPTTLQDSLMARLDRLAPVKAVAQVGAAIGREFSHDLLAAVTNVGDHELCHALDRLATAELIFRHHEASTTSYVFKHALVRDVAYSSLPRARRGELHARIAAVLEERFPQAAASEPEVLAHHWSEAGNAEKAAGYHLSAGTRALRRSATAEAVAQLARGLEILRQMPATALRERRELALQVAYGAAMVAARGPAAPEPAKAYVRARELCRQLGEERSLLPVLFGLWASYNVRNELRAAYAVATELLDLASQKPPGPTIILGYRALGTTQLLQGNFMASQEFLTKLLDIDRSVVRVSSDFPYPFDPWLTGQAYLSISVLLLGYPEQALAHARQALAGAHQLQHHSTLALVLFCRCVLGQLLRDRVDLETHAEALSTVAAEQSFTYWLAAGAVFRGWCLAESGQLSDGIARMRDGLAAYEATGAQAYVSDMMVLLAEVNRRAGNAGQGQKLLHDALERTKRAGAYAGEAELHRLQGELHLSLPSRNLMKAQASFRRALEAARNQEARWLELRAIVSLARLLAEQGHRRDASNLLHPICGWFTEGANTPDLQDARKLLEELL